MKANDAYQHRVSGDIYHQIGEKFQKRFLNATDYDLINHGMGHLAGSYGSAVKLINLNTGRTATFSLEQVYRNFVQISE